MFRHFCGYAKNNIQNAGRQAGLCKGFTNCNRSCRSFLTWFYRNRTACCKCAGNFTHHICCWKIPCYKCQRWSNRYLPSLMLHARKPRGNDPAVDSLSLLAVPTQQIDSNLHFYVGFGEWLTHLTRQVGRNFIKILLKNACGLLKNNLPV